MEDGGEGRQRVGSRHLHLAHHVHHDGTGLSHGELNLAAAVACAQGGAQMSVGLTDGHAAHVHGSEAFDGHGTVGRHGALDAFLRGTVDVDKHGVARSQTVVLWRGDIHIGFEGQVFVVEDVTSEHFLLVPVALGQQLLEQGRRVGHKRVQLVLHHHPLGVRLVVGRHGPSLWVDVFHLLRGGLLSLVVLASFAVSHAAAVLCAGRRRQVTQASAFHVTFHQFLNAAQLLDIHTALHQFRYDLFL